MRYTNFAHALGTAFFKTSRQKLFSDFWFWFTFSLAISSCINIKETLFNQEAITWSFPNSLLLPNVGEFRAIFKVANTIFLNSNSINTFFNQSHIFMILIFLWWIKKRQYNRYLIWFLNFESEKCLITACKAIYKALLINQTSWQLQMTICKLDTNILSIIFELITS